MTNQTDGPALRQSGRVAIVTGASRGIGAAIATRLARDGAAVMIVYRSQSEAADRVAQAIVAGGGRAATFAADLAEPDAAGRMVEATLAAFGRVDILVNNAGVAVTGDAATMSSARVDEALELSLHAPLHCSQAVIDQMASPVLGAYCQHQFHRRHGHGNWRACALCHWKVGAEHADQASGL